MEPLSPLGTMTNGDAPRLVRVPPFDFPNLSTNNGSCSTVFPLPDVTLLTNPVFSFRTNIVTFMSAGRFLGSTNIVTTVTNWTLADQFDEVRTSLDSLAIVGRGYFIVSDALGSLFVTRDGGSLRVDGSGFLVTWLGLRVQGFNDPELSHFGDVRIDATYRPATVPTCAQIRSFSFDSDGRAYIHWSEGTTSLRGQILLQDFREPAKLQKEAPRLWRMTELAEPLLQPLPPKTQGLGSLAVGHYQYDLTVPSLSVSQVRDTSRTVAPGMIYATGNPNDLAIRGRGFFVLRDPLSNAFYVTRAGAFCLDPDGYLVNYAGWRVQGYCDSIRTQVGDLLVDTTGRPASPRADALISYWKVDGSGSVWVHLSDGRTFQRGAVLLQDCVAPQNLVRGRWGAYTRQAEAGPWTPLDLPGYYGMGLLVAGALEISELDEEIVSAPQRRHFLTMGQSIRSDCPTDLAIAGRGFFMVRDPQTGVLSATRYGAFRQDAGGFLVTSGGLRLQGFCDPGLSIPGDIVASVEKAPMPVGPDATVTSCAVYGRWGEVWAHLSNGSAFRCGQILLQNFRNPSALRPESDHLWSNIEAAMPMFSAGVPGPNAMALGSILPQRLEIPPSPLTVRLVPQSGLRLVVWDLPVIPGLECVIERSSDLENWQRVCSVYPADIDQAEVFCPAPSSGSMGVYRIRLLLDPGLKQQVFPDPGWVGPFQVP